MPIYEYQCKKCGYQFEKIQKMTDEPCRTCPECEADEVQKMVTSPAFQLKGTGWYVTDFRDKQKKPAKPKADSGESSSETGGTTATDQS